jgi:hypothetical protein
MMFLWILGALVGVFLLWNLSGYWKYRRRERMDKNEIGAYLSRGDSLVEAIEKAFGNLNAEMDLRLQNSTIRKVAEKISDFQSIMPVENVVEIYSTCMSRYVFQTETVKNPTGVSDEQILYAIEKVELIEQNGYFVVAADRTDIEKKYPSRTSLKTKYLTLYTYLLLPLGILVDAGHFFGYIRESLFFYAIIQAAFVLGMISLVYGLHARRLWAWRLNWGVLVVVFMAKVFAASFNGDGDFVAGGFIGAAIGSTMVFYLHYIYFTKRKSLFSSRREVES